MSRLYKVIFLAIIGSLFIGAWVFDELYHQEELSTQDILIESAVVSFMSARMQKDQENQELALSWLTDNAKQQYFSSDKDTFLFGLANPYFAGFEILKREQINDSQFRYKVRIYEEYTGQGRVGYFDENLIIIKQGDRCFIDSFRQGEYINL